jgi:hypothetical protein
LPAALRHRSPQCSPARASRLRGPRPLHPPAAVAESNSTASFTSYRPSSTSTPSRPPGSPLSAPLPLLRDSHGLSTGDASRVFSVFPSPPVEPLRFLSTDAPRRLLAASVRGCLMWLCQTPRPGYELASTSTVHLSLDSETARSGSGMRTILVRVQSTRLSCNMICGTGNDLEFKVLSLQVQH